MSQKKDNRFFIDGKEYALRIKKESLSCDPLYWLEKSAQFPKFFWKGKSSQKTFYASGSLLDFSEIPSVKSSFPLYIFGGGSPHQDRYPWKGFPKSYFFLPQELLIEKGKNLQLITYHLEKTPSHLPQYRLEERPAFSYAFWEERVKKALHLIEKKELLKIVLGKVHRTASQITPFTLLRKLLKAKAKSYYYLFAVDPDTAFVGASPELLLKKRGKICKTEAIAATRKRLFHKKSDALLEKELLDNQKESLEFNLVKEEILKRIHPFSQSMKLLPQDKVIKTPTLLHRYNQFLFTLKEEMETADLIRLLHPTPAISGLPREKAAKIASELEDHERGWYAAPIGYAGEKDCEFAVAIRSALLHKEEAFLFSAAGLVIGSDPQAEWDELHNKLAYLESLL